MEKEEKKDILTEIMIEEIYPSRVTPTQVAIEGFDEAADKIIEWHEAENQRLREELKKAQEEIKTLKEGIVLGDDLYGNLIGEDDKSPLMRLKEENEKLKAENDLYEQMAKDDPEIEALKAEIERLKGLFPECWIDGQAWYIDKHQPDWHQWKQSKGL
jgi:hypothetical protein